MRRAGVRMRGAERVEELVGDVADMHAGAARDQQVGDGAADPRGAGGDEDPSPARQRRIQSSVISGLLIIRPPLAQRHDGAEHDEAEQNGARRVGQGGAGQQRLQRRQQQAPPSMPR